MATWLCFRDTLKNASRVPWSEASSMISPHSASNKPCKSRIETVGIAIGSWQRMPACSQTLNA